MPMVSSVYCSADYHRFTKKCFYEWNYALSTEFHLCQQILPNGRDSYCESNSCPRSVWWVSAVKNRGKLHSHTVFQ